MAEKKTKAQPTAWLRWWNNLDPEKRAYQLRKKHEKQARYRERNRERINASNRKFGGHEAYNQARQIARQKELERQRAEWEAYKQERLNNLGSRS